MAPSIDSFLDGRIADRWGPSRNEANALRELLRGSVTPEEAAERFTSDARASRTINACHNSLDGMWILIKDTAGKYPEHHAKLVQLMDAVRRLPNLQIGGENVEWSELPNLPECWGEHVFDRDEMVYSEETISVIAFTAQLCAHQVVDHNEFLSAAELDFHAAFEKTPLSGSVLKAEDIHRLNATVPVAAQWIFYAGETIYNCEETFGLKVREGLWTGQPGFSYGRWKLWKERAEWVCSLKRVVRHETIEIARAMVEKMTQIENNDA
ncbi:uncharacterized protein F4822DRAFT_421861 [Hypoxylon trugodes]|uniref:uncharacterized protein n=1 Tax=Hypoxylon trugodes TaxID=326681 RepID=UPI00219D5502|nr:uncharacterized protein F4822DRAFT_421861 [Hypoxylon trugodes]KAI1383025.1 hypothetical protein F4822DRAFT_421861 [Hypoxylon trugodes]